jgi:hypothetical protein
MMIATNGHIMAIRYLPEASWPDGCPNVIVSSNPDLIRAAKAKKADSVVVEVEAVNRGKVTVMSADTSPDTMKPSWCSPDNILIDGTFPNWHPLIPEAFGDHLNLGPHGDAINPELLLRVAAGSGANHPLISLSGQDSTYVGRPRSTHGPIAVRVADEPDYFGIIMPARSRMEGSMRPAWLDAPTPAMAVAA